MRFSIISALVLVPLAALLSLLPPLVAGAVEKPIGPEFVAPQTGVADATRGEALYRSKCYGCHVSEANVGPAHNSVDFKVRYADEETIAVVVRAGRQPMPAFTEQMLSDQELADVIAYIRSLPAP
ncbi:MAG: cytochrome c [Ardenticatenaceae bacterium]|nr:cytochrome c [Ardenticatenaceae bacterium]